MKKQIMLILVLSILFSSFSYALLTDDLISYYNSDTIGSYPDSLGTNDGTLNGPTFTTAGKINGAYNYSGADGNSTNLTFIPEMFNVTFSQWIKVNKNKLQGIFTSVDSTPDGFLLNLESDGTIRWKGFGNGGASTPHGYTNEVLTLDKWYLITVTTNGSLFSVFINGTEATYSSQTQSDLTAITSEGHTNLGIYFLESGFDARTLNGTIDEVGYWERILTDNEIFNLYNGGNGISYPFVQIDNCSNFTTHSLNITFRDEQTNNKISSNFESSYNFTVNNIDFSTFDYDDDSKSNYSICIFPNEASATTNYDITYSASGYQSRLFIDEQVLSNQTISQDLFLLNLSNGIFARFKTIDNLENVITDVLGVMRKSGESEIIEAQITDDSGLATFFVNPDQTYDFTFSKTGIGSESFSIRPTTGEIFSVVMGGGLVAQEPPVSSGVTYNFYPVSSPLVNNTDTDFSFNLTSTSYGLQGCNFRLKFVNGTVLSETAGIVNASTCNLGLNENTDSWLKTANTSNYTTIIAEGSYTNGTINVTQTKTYAVLKTYTGDFSLKVFIQDISNFSEGGFNDKTRLLIAFITIMVITVLASEFGGLTNPEGIAILIWAQVGFFSFVGWLRSANENLPVFGNFEMQQWLIFILMTLITMGYLIRVHK